MKVAWAAFGVGVAESENTTVSGPVEMVGTMKVEPLKEPVALVVVVPVRVRGDPLKVAFKAELGANA